MSQISSQSNMKCLTSHELIMTRTSTFTQSCEWQNCLCAFAVSLTAFATNASYKFPANSAGFRKTAPKNIPFSITAASPSPSIRLWECHLWLKHPTPDVTGLVYCSSRVLKYRAPLIGGMLLMSLSFRVNRSTLSSSTWCLELVRS